MKKIMITTAVLLGLSVPAVAGNQQVVDQAWRFDQRITQAYIFNDDTVVLRGHWPRKGPSFQADSVARSWCWEFDEQIRFIQLRTADDSRMIGGAQCA